MKWCVRSAGHQSVTQVQHSFSPITTEPTKVHTVTVFLCFFCQTLASKLTESFCHDRLCYELMLHFTEKSCCVYCKVQHNRGSDSVNITSRTMRAQRSCSWLNGHRCNISLLMTCHCTPVSAVLNTWSGIHFNYGLALLQLNAYSAPGSLLIRNSCIIISVPHSYFRVWEQVTGSVMFVFIGLELQ